MAWRGEGLGEGWVVIVGALGVASGWVEQFKLTLSVGLYAGGIGTEVLGVICCSWPM